MSEPIFVFESDTEGYRLLCKRDPIAERVFETCSVHIGDHESLKFAAECVANLEAENASLKAEVRKLARNQHELSSDLLRADNYERTWAEFWEPIIKRGEKGEQDQIKRELHDYYMQMINWEEAIYCLTSGKLSKSTYSARTIIDQVTETFERDE